MISSSSNQQIKNLIQLQTKAKYRNKEKVFIIEGLKMFQEILSMKNGDLIKVFISESFFKHMEKTQPEFIDSLKLCNYDLVSDKVFREISDTITPQGILAIVKQPQYSFEEIINHDKINIVILEDLRDPGNLGTIMRTAEGAGVTGIILSKNSVDIFNPKVIRSTMGGIYRVPFLYVEDIHDTMKQLQQQQIQIYATHLRSTKFYDDIEYGDRTGIVVGNEANGITDRTVNQADTLIKIPMEGSVESLNAGVATAIMMYEIYRQHRKK